LPLVYAVSYAVRIRFHNSTGKFRIRFQNPLVKLMLNFVGLLIFMFAPCITVDDQIW
jgi:hypothetical protein